MLRDAMGAVAKRILIAGGAAAAVIGAVYLMSEASDSTARPFSTRQTRPAATSSAVAGSDAQSDPRTAAQPRVADTHYGAGHFHVPVRPDVSTGFSENRQMIPGAGTHTQSRQKTHEGAGRHVGTVHDDKGARYRAEQIRDGLGNVYDWVHGKKEAAEGRAWNPYYQDICERIEDAPGFRHRDWGRGESYTGTLGGFTVQTINHDNAIFGYGPCEWLNISRGDYEWRINLNSRGSQPSIERFVGGEHTRMRGLDLTLNTTALHAALEEIDGLLK